MSGHLHNRVAIVTGAGCIGPGWGNGRAIAVRFAEEGARIFAVDRDLDSVAETVERVKAAGGEIVTHPCDVTGAASVGQGVETVVAQVLHDRGTHFTLDGAGLPGAGGNVNNGHSG